MLFVRLASSVGGGGVLSRDASVGGSRRVPNRRLVVCPGELPD